MQQKGKNPTGSLEEAGTLLPLQLLHLPEHRRVNSHESLKEEIV